MAEIEFTVKTYNESGLISTETFMIPEPITLEQKIAKKEQELLRMYNALEELKSLRGQ